MTLKSKAIKIYAKHIAAKIRKDANNAISDQNKCLTNLLQKAATTQFGKDHHFKNINSASDFKQAVPIREYELLKDYVESIKSGNSNVLWPGKPKYFAKTSGTTSGVKYIPISQASIHNHINTARNVVLNYIDQSKKDVLSGKTIFISGSPDLELVGGIKTGRLSGIVNHEIPFWVKRSQLPSYPTNCIEDWERKLDSIVDETSNQDMRLISGIPPWVQMYYERLLATSGKANIKSLFPNMSVFMHGGVNFQPYKEVLTQLHGDGIDTIETYPASEGFIAFQNVLEDDSLILNTNSGIYFEFTPLDKAHKASPPRLSLEEVKLNTDYALVISNNAGLWAYNLGDTIRFTALNPYKIKVSGRIKHFISAFGEHVIAKEVEQAAAEVGKAFGLVFNEFTVAPQISPSDSQLPYHEWFIEFNKTPPNLKVVAAALNEAMVTQNIYYKDLIVGKVLNPLVIRPLRTGSFRKYMQSIGKLGGQNKVPRLLNDRSVADKLEY